jgi:hydrogenase maturation protein HypF
MAAAYLDGLDGLDGLAGLDGLDRQGPASLDVMRRNSAQWAAVVAMARKGVNAPLTSSAGRLFDAVAALLGVRDAINYEGQAAIELEQLADPAERGGYHAAIDAENPGRYAGPERTAAPAAEAAAGPAPEAGRPFHVRGADLVRAAAGDLAAGVPPAVIAARFHNGVAAVVAAACLRIRERHALTTVALSGGVFQNMLLLNQVVTRLESRGFTVLTHSRVPCNDGGISLGQAVIAAARDRLGSDAPAAGS